MTSEELTALEEELRLARERFTAASPSMSPGDRAKAEQQLAQAEAKLAAAKAGGGDMAQGHRLGEEAAEAIRQGLPKFSLPSFEIPTWAKVLGGTVVVGVVAAPIAYLYLWTRAAKAGANVLAAVPVEAAAPFGPEAVAAVTVAKAFAAKPPAPAGVAPAPAPALASGSGVPSAAEVMALVGRHLKPDAPATAAAPAQRHASAIGRLFEALGPKRAEEVLRAHGYGAGEGAPADAHGPPPSASPEAGTRAATPARAAAGAVPSRAAVAELVKSVLSPAPSSAPASAPPSQPTNGGPPSSGWLAGDHPVFQSPRSAQPVSAGSPPSSQPASSGFVPSFGAKWLAAPSYGATIFQPGIEPLLAHLEARSPEARQVSLGLEQRKALERVVDEGSRSQQERAHELLKLHDIANGYEPTSAPRSLSSGLVSSGPVSAWPASSSSASAAVPSTSQATDVQALVDRVLKSYAAPSSPPSTNPPAQTLVSGRQAAPPATIPEVPASVAFHNPPSGASRAPSAPASASPSPPAPSGSAKTLVSGSAR